VLHMPRLPDCASSMLNQQIIVQGRAVERPDATPFGSRNLAGCC
jgi:hypothetical protein